MRQKPAIIVLFLIACYFPLFLHLDSLALFSYDEARLALNALEMIESGELLVTYFNGEPDLWNTKPPLMIWLQALSIKVFGVNELGVRFPSALAAFFTVLYIGIFCYKYLERPFLGLFSALVLITIPGYIAPHVARTGDYDSLLILFSISFALTLYRFLSSDNQHEKRKSLIWLSIWLSLSVFTKSVAGLLFVPAATICILWKGEWRWMIKSKYFYYALILFFAFIGGYYGVREFLTPGYLEAVWNNELGGRYFEVLENHKAPFLYYFNNIWNSKFLPWLFFLPLSLCLAFAEKGKNQDLVIFLLIFSLSFLLIISLSKSKLEWYDAPVYPLLAIIIAIGIEILYLKLLTYPKVPQFILTIIFCTAFFGMPYKSILSSVYLPKHTNPKNQYASFMKQFPKFDNYSIVGQGYNAQILFYEKLYKEKGYQVQFKYPDQLAVGEVALICEAEVLDDLNKSYNYKIIEEWRSCILVSISDTGR